jgi:hypothetical protein
MDDFSEIFEFLSKRRKYAAGFEWGTKSQKERDVGEEFLKALFLKCGIEWKGLENSLLDPPDLFCVDSDGRSIGIEVTEVVCQQAIEMNQKGVNCYRNWTPDTLRSAMFERLIEKDGVTFKGDAPDSYVVVLFNAEIGVWPTLVDEAISDFEFGPFSKINRAFLLLNRFGGDSYCPIYELKIK